MNNQISEVQNNQSGLDESLDDPRLALCSQTSNAVTIIDKSPILPTAVLDVEIEMGEKAYVRYRDDLIFRMAKLGELYAMKKAELEHGRFTPWIKTRELLTHDEVNRCMRVFSEFPEVLLNYAPVRNLDKKTILEIVYAPDDVKNEIKERLEAGKQVTRKEVVALKKQHKEALKPTKPVKKDEIEDHSHLGKGKVDDIIEGEFTEVQPKPGDDDPIELLSADNLVLMDHVERLTKIVESNDQVKTALDELKIFKELNRVLEERMRGLQGESNEAKGQAKYWKKKYEKLAKEVGHE